MSVGTTLSLDTIKPSDIQSNCDGLRVSRGFTIQFPTVDALSTAPKPVGTGISDPGVLLNALTFLASQSPSIAVGEPYPSAPSGSISNAVNLCLVDITFNSWSADTKLLGGRLTYFTPLINGIGSPVVSFNENFTTGTEETTSTFAGDNNIAVWYGSGIPANTTTQPASNTISTLTEVQKYTATGTLEVKIPFGGTFWNSVLTTYRAAVSYVNQATWGTYARGTWILVGVNAMTNDFGFNYMVTFTFQYNPYGWYPVGEVTAEGGDFAPDDRDTVANLLALGPPSVGGVKNLNGLVRASVQGEADFVSLFSSYFTPLGIT
jgi:hypothetical protein